MNIQGANTIEGILLTSLDEHGVLRITLNNPVARNSLSEAMLSALQDAFDKARDDVKIRVVILSAIGPVFSAGHDMKEITSRRADADNGKAYFQEILAICSKLMMSIVTCPKPVIAEVSGMATAAGLQLASSCDMIIASEEARFCTPGVNIGLFCSTPMVALSRAVSRKHAMEMLLTGDMMDVETAYRFGLVNRIVERPELSAVTEEIAHQIAAKSAAVVAIGKEAFYKQKELSLEEAYTYCSEVMVTNLLMKDSEEGICAFIEKRDADWKDR
ncbi:MAG: enoyl-CoA hydratase [Hyphomicrobiales bacterium]